MRITQLKQFAGFERAHFEQSRGTPQQNEEYCTKEGAVGGPYRSGEIAICSKQGMRNDLVKLRNAVKAGKRFIDLVDDDDLVLPLAKHPRFFERMEKELGQSKAREGVKVTLHYGPAGTGKTHCACGGKLVDDDTYYFDGTAYWEGYTNQRRVILDEFGGHVLSPLMFQRVCDKYPLTVPIKGSSAPLCADDIHICTNYLPDRWWKEGTRYNRDAVVRRIHEAHFHHTYMEVERFVSDEDGYAVDKMIAWKARREFRRPEDIIRLV